MRKNIKVSFFLVKLKKLLLWSLLNLIGKTVILFSYKKQIKLGFILTYVMYPFIKERKRITMKNLKTAFPQKNIKEIKSLCKKSFCSISAAAVEMIIAWFAPIFFLKK